MNDPATAIERSPRNGLRTGMGVAEIKKSFLENLLYGMGRAPEIATPNDLYTALALTVRDRVLHHSIHTMETYWALDVRRVAYLSAEFLPGPHLASALLNLGILEQTRQAMAELGYSLDDIVAQEEEPALGNGGLGRLASCYMDSLACLEIPAVGYGIRYEFGMFDQSIVNGWQTESSDRWLRFGNPWEICRTEIAYEVKFGGYTRACTGADGKYRVEWKPSTAVKGVAYDTPRAGYRVGTCELLRLWKAEAVETFDFAAFNVGNYIGAVEAQIASENITKILYPNDASTQGKALRLRQQLFFVSCSLQDMLRVHALLDRQMESFHLKYAIQLNDTHPSIAVAELMRLLVDEHDMDWDIAWRITVQAFSYTNHTLLPEALEHWPLGLFAEWLPRHLEIIYEINRRFLQQVRACFPGDEARVARMSLIDESGERYVRMAHLAAVGSHKINGVARLHSQLMKETVFRDFAELWPDRFCNVTNGVTPRRFIAVSNPDLAQLITSRIGDGWLRDLSLLRHFEPLAGDFAFQQQWRAVKQAAKRRLAQAIKQRTGITIDPESLFDIHAKRIHEYKRQHLNVLHIVTLYLRLKRDRTAVVPARTFIFGGKAAPSYSMAKLIIKLISAVADLVNRDQTVRGRINVVFYPNYNVKNAQRIIPAADISEQISTAGMEASGTGNMKFALNGALTIGTLDGANVEIREEIGPENFFLFGLDAAQVKDLRAKGYRPRDYYENNLELREVIDFIAHGLDDEYLFKPLVENLLEYDPFLVLADYESYIRAQEQVSALWSDQQSWIRKSILTAARMGRFSSDRAIQQYCERIWHVEPVPVIVRQ